MWADAQRDGRPAEYRWRRLQKFLNSIPCTTPQSLADARYCQYMRTQDLNAKCILHVAKFRQGAKAPKMYIQCTSQGDGQRSCKVWLASDERRRCSNEGKTRNPMKFAGVPQTDKPISAVSGPKFTILSGHVGEILLLNKVFSNCRYVP